MKAWKLNELHETFDKFKKIYFEKIQIKDKILHFLFRNTIEKFAIATLVYAYELGLSEKKLHHLGIAIKRENSLKYLDIFKKYGGKSIPSGICEAFETSCAFIDMGGWFIELISDTDKGNLVSKYLEKHKEGSIHHIAFRKKFKGGVKGALPRMRVRFNTLDKQNKLLIEEVDFDGY